LLFELLFEELLSSDELALEELLLLLDDSSLEASPLEVSPLEAIPEELPSLAPTTARRVAQRHHQRLALVRGGLAGVNHASPRLEVSDTMLEEGLSIYFSETIM
jgi:hypothetical protein